MNFYYVNTYIVIHISNRKISKSLSITCYVLGIFFSLLDILEQPHQFCELLALDDKKVEVQKFKATHNLN